MSITRIRRRWMYLLGFAVMVVASLGAVKWRDEYTEQGFEGKAKVRMSGITSPDVINASPELPAFISKPAAGTGFTPQTRLGFHVDNEWEPAIAADKFSHVYVLYPQYGGVPGCATCYSPTHDSPDQQRRRQDLGLAEGDLSSGLDGLPGGCSDRRGSGGRPDGLRGLAAE